MSLALPPGGNVLLSDVAPGIERIRIGLGWDDVPGPAAVDLDGVVILVDGTAQPAQALLTHQVPNPGEPLGAPPPPHPLVGDAEKIVVTLAAVPSGISRLQFGALIAGTAGGPRTFRSVRAPYVRLVNQANGVELARHAFEPETGRERFMIFGELYRHPAGWKFRAVGQGYDRGLPGLASAGGHGLAPAPPGEVASFLTRTSRARTRRTVAEYLTLSGGTPAAVPSHPASPAPAPSPPAPSPPAPSSPAPSSPARPQSPHPRAAHPRPPAAHPRPPRPHTTPTPAPARSPLDLGGHDENVDLGGQGGQAPASTAVPATSGPPAAGPPPAGPPPGGPPGAGLPDAGAPGAGGPTRPARAPIVFGERSSRHRQRLEHVGTLDDDHPATAWTAQNRGTGTLSLTLRWTTLTTRAGLPRPGNIHLGCFWQALDGAVGVLRTPGDAAASSGPPARQVLRLGRRDEREGQTIFADLDGLLTLRRVFVYAYGLHRAPEWAQLRPALTVTVRTGEQLTMRLGDPAPDARICVVASLHMAQDDVIIRRENDFLAGTEADAARRYGWSLDWNPDGTTLRDSP